MRVCWFSAGASSFAAAYLVKDTLDRIVYTAIDDQHPDSDRFIHDCELALNMKHERLQSPYKSVENVIRQMRYINSPYGAPCTNILKRRVRKEFEFAHKGEPLEYVWGFDCNEKGRAERVVEANPQATHLFPLIDNDITKSDAHGICEKLGIRRPIMYDLGFANNNCIGCVKGGMGYWNKIRREFPDVFASRAKLERDIGASAINGCFLDELDPNAGRESKDIPIECSIFCEIAIGGQP
jgi:hypothetical protein